MSNSLPSGFEDQQHHHRQVPVQLHSQIPPQHAQHLLHHPDQQQHLSQHELQMPLHPQQHNPLKRNSSAASLSEGPEDNNDDDISDDEDGRGKGRQGRRKIKIEYIEDKSRRHITFSKRKAGIMKKAYELSTLTGTQVLLLVASETGHVYTFATPKLQPLITKPDGKNLIQACLNAPDPNSNGTVYAAPYTHHPYQQPQAQEAAASRLQAAYESHQQNGEPADAATLASAALFQAEKQQQQQHQQQQHASHAAALQQYAMQNAGYPAGFSNTNNAALAAAQVAAGMSPYMYPYSQLAQQQYGGLVGTQQAQAQAQAQAHAQAQAQQQQSPQPQQQSQQSASSGQQAGQASSTPADSPDKK